VPAVPELDVPGLDAERIVLRGWTLTPRDITAVTSGAADPDIARFSSVGVATTPKLAAAWIRSRDEEDRLDWVISSPNAGLGRVSLAHIDPVDGVAELGYWLLPEDRGRGIATAVVGAVEQHAFSALGLARLVIRHEPENQRSCLLAQRRGYQEEGTQRGAFERQGVRRDLHVHARLATDPPVTPALEWPRQNAHHRKERPRR
jgi:RimJ/RimL family protein N-acetyltransferase